MKSPSPKSPSLVALLKAGPADLLRRAVFKTFVGPWIYGRRNRYDAGRYWSDRFRRYGMGMKSSGYEGVADADNFAMKAAVSPYLLEAIARAGLDVRTARILDLGCGNGFYARVFRDAGARGYTGVDIADVLFPELRKAYPASAFVKADVCAEPLPGGQDFIFMFDVIQSIVTAERLAGAMARIREGLAPGGTFLVAPLFDATRGVHFYSHQWSKEDVLAHFPGYAVSDPIPFRDLKMYALRKPVAGG